jgi:hypothetical protein
MPRINAKGSLLNAEGFAIHEDRLNRRAESIDPSVRVFLERGRAMSSADLIRLQRGRAQLVSAMDLRKSPRRKALAPKAQYSPATFSCGEG